MDEMLLARDGCHTIENGGRCAHQGSDPERGLSVFIATEESMGTRGREIVGMNVDDLLKLLNQAYASEWLAYYQYWLGAKVIKGPMKDAVAAELNLHATEELNHGCGPDHSAWGHSGLEPEGMVRSEPLPVRRSKRSVRGCAARSKHRRRAMRDLDVPEPHESHQGQRHGVL